MKLFIMLLAACLLAGCSVNPSGVSQKYAQGFVNNMTYAKDSRTGLCFGVAASRRTAKMSSTGIGVVSVPCDKVEHLLTN